MTTFSVPALWLQGNPTTPTPVISLSGLTEGNLLVAVLNGRSGQTTGNLTIADGNGATWVKRAGLESLISDPNARHTVNIWTRAVTAADAASGLVLNFDDTSSTSNNIFAYVLEVSASAAYAWTFEEIALASSGTADWDGLSSGNTSSIAGTDLFELAVAVSRVNGSDPPDYYPNLFFNTQTDSKQANTYAGGHTSSMVAAIEANGQDGGVKSATFNAWSGTGNEGVVAVLVFSGGGTGIAGTGAGMLPLGGSGGASVGDAASASGAVPLGGTGAASVADTGLAAGSLALAGAAAGSVSVEGATQGGLPLSGSAVGTVGAAPNTGVINGALPLGGAGDSTVDDAGLAAGAIALSGAAAGSVSAKGVVQGDLPLGGTAAGNAGAAPNAGVVGGSLSLDGAGMAAVAGAGGVAGSLDLAGSATGAADIAITAEGMLPLAGIVLGAIAVGGQMQGDMPLDGSGSSVPLVLPAAAISGVWRQRTATAVLGSRALGGRWPQHQLAGLWKDGA